MWFYERTRPGAMTSSGTDEPFIDQLDAGTGGYNEPTPEVNDRGDESQILA